MNTIIEMITLCLQALHRALGYLVAKDEADMTDAECLGVGAVMPNELSQTTLSELGYKPVNLC